MIGKVKVTSTGYDPDGPPVNDPTLSPKPLSQVLKGEALWAAVRQHAQEQGYYLIKVSPRVYEVIGLVKTTIGKTSFTSGGPQYAILSGEVLVRGTHEECMKWIEKNVKPLPKHLWSGG